MKKILIVSLGSIGLRHYNNLKTLLPSVEIAVYRQFFKKIDNFKEIKFFFKLEEALQFQADAVIISSPASEHIKNALAFLKNGAHLFVEKPIAMHADEASNLVEASKNSDKFSMTGYVLRFQPLVSYLKNIIDSGKLGDIWTTQIEVGQYLPDWRPTIDYRVGVSGQKKLGGGVLLELSHEIDYATWFFGDPYSLFCSAEKLSNLDIDVEDSACIVMEYNPGGKVRRVVINLDFLQRSANMSVKIVGSKATLEADLIKEVALLIHPSGEIEDLNPPKMQTGNEMYLRQLDFFLSKCFRDYKVCYKGMDDFNGYTSIERAAEVLKLVDISKKSNKIGKRLRT